MLTKEAKQKAEAIRQEFASLFDKGEKLAKAYQKESAKSSAKYRDWFAWSSAGTSGHAADTLGKEEADMVATLRHTNPKEWHEITAQKWKEYQEASERQKVAKINALNYTAWIAEKLRGRVSQDLDTFKPRGGLSSLGEYLRRENWAGQPLGVFFSLWCGDLHEVRITQTAGGGVGADNWHAQGIEEPQALTLAQYRRTLAELKKIKEQAEALKNKSRRIVRRAGLLGFAPMICDIKETY